MSDSVQFFGIKSDGTEEFLGFGKETPAMKIKEIVRNYFGEPSDDETGTNADLCMWALDDFHKWMIEQGYVQENKIILNN